MYTVTVTSFSLHVRSKPKFESNPVAWIHEKDTFSSSKVQNGWYYIDAKKGWSNGKFLKVVEKPKPLPPPPPKPAPPPKVEETLPPEVVEEAPGLGKIPTKVMTMDPTLSSSNNMVNLAGGIESPIKDDSGTQLMDNMIASSNLSLDDSYIPSSIAAASVSRAPSNKLPGLMSVSDTIKAMGPTMANSFGSKKFQEPEGNFSYAMNPGQDIINLSKNLNVIKHNLNIWNDKDPAKLHTQFNRFKTPMVDGTLTKIIPYVFFTRPSINVVDPVTRRLKEQFSSDPLFTHIMASSPNILHGLGESLSPVHHFNPLLSNSARSFEPQDEILRTVQTGDTYTGWKMVYGRNTNESNTAGQFNIQYQDNKDAEIYKTHKAWITYINNVYRGIWNVRKITLERKILNYASSVYYIVCAADGETILYWVKYYGVFPINTPASSMSWSSGTSPGIVDFVINYVYSMKEDYNPITIAEFNSMSTAALRYKPIYDKRILGSPSSLSGAPFIDQTTSASGKRVYKLRFRN